MTSVPMVADLEGKLVKTDFLSGVNLSFCLGLFLFLNFLEFSSLYPKGDMQFPHFLRKSFAATLIVFSSFAFLSMVSSRGPFLSN